MGHGRKKKRKKEIAETKASCENSKKESEKK